MMRKHIRENTRPEQQLFRSTQGKKRGADQTSGGQNGAAREKGFINSNPLKTKGRWVSFRELRRPNWMNFRNFLDDLKNNFFGVKMTPPDKFTKFI